MLSFDELAEVDSIIAKKQQDILLGSEVPITNKILQSLTEVLSCLETKPVPWHLISLCLAHFKCIQNMCVYMETMNEHSVEFQSDSVPNDPDRIPSNELVLCLMEIACKEIVILRYTANAALLKLLIGKQNGWHEEKIKLIFDFVLASQERKLFYGLDVITALTKTFPDSEISSHQSLHEVLKKSTVAIQKEFNGSDFSTYLDFLMSLIADNPCFKDKVTELENSVISDFSASFKYTHVRIKYLKLLRSLLPMPTSSKEMDHSSAAKIFARKLLSAMMDYIPIRDHHKPPTYGFGGAKGIDVIGACSTAEAILMINIMLKCLAMDMADCDVIEQAGICTKHLVCEGPSVDERTFASSFVELHLDQDDLLIEALLLHLSIFAYFCQLSEQPTRCLFSPHLAFMYLLHNLSFDSSVLLDWLTSNETQFLLYFIKYIKFSLLTKANVLHVYKTQNSSIENLSKMLNELKMSVQKLVAANLFPYSANPLLRNIDHFQVLLSK